MRSTKRASFFLFAASAVLVPATAITACGDDETAIGPSTLLDASADRRSSADAAGVLPDANDTDARENPVDSGTDTGTPTGDADADAAPPDASTPDVATPDADATTAPTSVANGVYTITAWTCSSGGTTKDIKAFAATLGIGDVDLTVNGAAGSVDSIYTGAPACTRSSAVTIAYPAAGSIATTNAPAHTCSATCSSTQCPAEPDPVHVDTFTFTTTTTSFTATRTMDAASVNDTLAAAAGCLQGYAEDVTYTKK